MNIRRMIQFCEVLDSYVDGRCLVGDAFPSLFPTKFKQGPWLSYHRYTSNGKIVPHDGVPVTGNAVGILMLSAVPNKEGFRYNPFKQRPAYNGDYGINAVASYLDIPIVTAEWLFHPVNFNADERSLSHVIVRIASLVLIEQNKWYRKTFPFKQWLRKRDLAVE